MNTIIEVNQVSKSFKKSETQDLLVLDNVCLSMREGEIVALLGKSGSGKSTLLRIIAGLIEPTSGEVFCRGEKVTGPVPGVSMVFQSFALMPWLTVLQNVELGLEALGIKRNERRQRAIEAIDIIGLDGFESAYPKELSGGMRQRVGFARALVVNPDILLMDEPFSALDVLTADNLRSDLLDLWHAKKTNTKGILFVTHNIEEAVALADRIIIFGSNPGAVRADLKVNIQHPRQEQSAGFRQLVDEIYTHMTKVPGSAARGARGAKRETLDIGYRLPEVDISELTGLMETMVEAKVSRIDLPELAEELMLDVDELFPLTEVLQILHFAEVSDGDIELTPEGERFAEADILQRKQLFAQHLINYVPLARHIRRVLDERASHRTNKDQFLDELEDALSEKEAERVLRTVIDWGRYAEIFAYDDSANELSLEDPE